MILKVKALRQYGLPFAASTLCAVVIPAVLLMLVHSSFLAIPVQAGAAFNAVKPAPAKDAQTNGTADFSIIAERNLFRAKLKVELPKPKTPKELEEEALTNIIRPMILKGVWLGQNNNDIFAVIDRGPQRGVWIYRVGDSADRGLVVSEIQQNSVILKKDDFVASLKLFAKGFQRVHPKSGETRTEGSGPDRPRPDRPR